MEPCLNWRRYFFDSGGTAPLKKKQTSTAIAQLQQYWIYWHLKTSHEEETEPQEETQHLFISSGTRRFFISMFGTTD